MMKTNKETLQASMDKRLSFLDELPSCRTALMHRISQEEEPVMKKKLSVGLVFAIILVLFSVAALAAGLLLSPRASAIRIADQALEEQFGITAEMQTFFFRQQEELPDGSVRVTYEGVSTLRYPLGIYTALVRNGKAEITWNRSGEDTSGGYAAEAWGLDQLKQMMEDCLDADRKQAFLDRSEELSKAHETETAEIEEPASVPENYHEKRESDKASALHARKLSEEEMISIAREFIIGSYGLNGEQAARLELYTNSFECDENTWYEIVNGQPCFEVEYLLYQPQTEEQIANEEPLEYRDKDGYYKVFVNVETGAVEDYEYNSTLAGQG